MRMDDQHRAGGALRRGVAAAGFIFTFHFFNTHFRLKKFPMDTVIFSVASRRQKCFMSASAVQPVRCGKPAGRLSGQDEGKKWKNIHVVR